jgi:hypothetical protein
MDPITITLAIKVIIGVMQITYWGVRIYLLF